MGKVVIDKSMSLDGYITGPNPAKDQPLGEGGEAIFAWMMAPQPEPGSDSGDTSRQLSQEYDEVLGDTMEQSGAVIMGKRMFEMIDSPEGWVRPDGYQFDWPVFVMTHEVRPAVTKGKTPFSFVNDGPDSALRQAREAAGDKGIGVAGGNVCQQFIEAGLVDEISIHLVPVFLGDGVRLFDHLSQKQFECTGVRAGNGVTHLTYHLNRSDRHGEA
jgi:dihydrofolate reductase